MKTQRTCLEELLKWSEKRNFSQKTSLSDLDLDKPETQLALLDANHEIYRKKCLKKFKSLDHNTEFYFIFETNICKGSILYYD